MSRSAAYFSAVSRQSRAAPSEPKMIPNRASVRHDSGPRRPVTSGSTASAGSRTSSSTSSLVTDARSESLRLISGALKPGGVGRHDEAADPAVVRSARPDDGDVGDRAVGDPHLRAVEHPVGAVEAGAGAHRGRVGAGVGLGQPEAADRLAGGHPRQPRRPSARRSRASRSRTSPASPGPRPASGRRRRRPPARGRPGRTPWRWCRRSRSRSGASRAARPCRARPRARGRAATPRRTTGRGAAGPGRPSTSRTVCWMARSSSPTRSSRSKRSSGWVRGHALIASSRAASTRRAASGRALWPIRPIRQTVEAYCPTPAPISMS